MTITPSLIRDISRDVMQRELDANSSESIALALINLQADARAIDAVSMPNYTEGVTPYFSDLWLLNWKTNEHD